MEMRFKPDSHIVYDADKAELIFFNITGDKVIILSGAIAEFFSKVEQAEQFKFEQLLDDFQAAYDDYDSSEVKSRFQEIESSLRDLDLVEIIG